MNREFITPEWFNYVETPRSSRQTVKIDRILDERMKSFIRARRVNRFRFQIDRH